MSTPSSPTENNESTATLTKFMTFRLGNELFGIHAINVQTIIRTPDVTPVPKMPEEFKGMINLRGKVVPVIDLRTKFNLTPQGSKDRECVIIVNTPSLDPGNEDTMAGIVVDTVGEVVSLDQTTIDPSPEIGEAFQENFIIGIAKINANIATLLDIEAIIMDQEASTENG